jgi:hypothetical protein
MLEHHGSIPFIKLPRHRTVVRDQPQSSFENVSPFKKSLQVQVFVQVRVPVLASTTSSTTGFVTASFTDSSIGVGVLGITGRILPYGTVQVRSCSLVVPVEETTGKIKHDGIQVDNQRNLNRQH